MEGIQPLLQPVAHAILQAREELFLIMKDFPENLLWESPAGAASIAFHLQHLSGVLDRLFTYARDEELTAAQLQQLHHENINADKNLTIKKLLERFNKQVDDSLLQLKQTSRSSLTGKDLLVERKSLRL